MFGNTEIYTVDGVKQYGLMAPIVLPDASDVFVTVIQRYVNRWDLMAYDYYGDARLWWVIPQASMVVDVCSGPALGQILRVPNKSRVTGLVQ